MNCFLELISSSLSIYLDQEATFENNEMNAIKRSMAASNLFIIAHHMNNYKSVKEMRHDCTSQCTFNCLFILYKSFSFLMHQLAGKNCRF